MNTINTEVPAFFIGEVAIKRLEIAKIGFVAFCEVGDIAADGESDQKKVTNRIFRERIKRQVTAYDASNNAIKFDDAAAYGIPLKHAMAIKTALSQSDANEPIEGKPSTCKMLHKGDGMLTPIHISLGSPIKTGSEDKVIRELEFTARNLGDLEDFVSADTSLERAVALIRVAAPVGPNLTITVLPTWAIDQISLEDGVWIMQNVVPSFL
jgi:hypothetical protein